MSATALTLEQEVWRPRFNPWLIAGVVALAAFMEVLDTSIANVALPYIAGNLAASNDDATWVLTSYLVSNAIVLPISGWIAGKVGRKRFFMLCLFLFTVTSFLCGTARSLGILLFYRVLQGAGGGGLQPMAQAILADTFPPEQRGSAFALYGVTAVVAPTVGPTLGGWITFNYAWRWIFFINIPVGLLTLLLVNRFVDDPPYLSKLKAAGARLDYIGIALLTLGVGALQVLLDRGQEDDWFGSRFITTLVVVSAVCLVALVIWEWFQKEPVVHVRLYRSLNFSNASLQMFMLGFGYFSALVMVPLFLQTLLGYTAQVAGFCISPGGLALLFMMPVVGFLTTKFQARRLAAFGWFYLAFAMFISTSYTDLEISFKAAMWLRVIQSAGLGFLFVPINLSAYVGIAPEDNNAVAGLMNFMRNIGSSVGTSFVTTMLDRRSQYHQHILVNYIRYGNQNFQNAVDSMTRYLSKAGLGAHEAHAQAVRRIYARLLAEAGCLSYIDIYKVLAVASAIMFVLAFTLKKNEPGGGGEIAVG